MGEPGAEERGEAGGGLGGVGEAGFKGVAQRLSGVEGREGEVFLAFEAAVVDDVVDAMGGNPGGAASEFGEVRGGLGAIVVLDAGCAGSAALLCVEGEDQLVGGVVEGEELDVGLEAEAGAGVEGSDLVEGERSVLGVVKGFDEGPLDAGDVEGEAMAAAGVLGIAGEPLGKVGAEVAEGEGAAGMAAQ